MKKVELRNVSKTYDGQLQVIKDTSVTVNPGEFFVLVGPSGCGKSTLLRMIAGLENVSSGDLYIGEREANKLPPSSRDLSMVFQNYALYPHLTVEQNITFGLHTKKISKQEQLKRCHDAAEMLGLSEYLKRKPRNLSGGQRQRVALARAIVTHSPICLMDEPLSNLDAKLRAKMRSEIRQIQRKLGITMIYVTHDQTEAMTMADRMMILDKGVVQQVGQPLEIYNQPRNTFVASFIGSPPMNLAKVDITQTGLLLGKELTFNRLDGFYAGAMKEALIGIRPENVCLAQNSKVSFIGKVLNVEVLGTETLLTIEMGNHHWISRWNGQWNVKVGDEVPINVQEKDIYIFNSESGESIFSPPKEDRNSIEGVYV